MFDAVNSVLVCASVCSQCDTFDSLIMVALCNRADHYIFDLWFLSFFFFSSPNLSGRRLDVYHTSTRSVTSANLEWKEGGREKGREKEGERGRKGKDERKGGR